MDAYSDYLIDKFNTDGIAKYAKVLPNGIDLAGQEILPAITARILSFGSAKTRYENNLPVCRAEDIDTMKGCSACEKRKDCTPQIRLDVVHWSGIFRFYLSSAALRNFMLFLSALNQRQIPPAGTTITLAVLNRGRWGELRFSLAPINL